MQSRNEALLTMKNIRSGRIWWKAMTNWHCRTQLSFQMTIPKAFPQWEMDVSWKRQINHIKNELMSGWGRVGDRTKRGFTHVHKTPTSHNVRTRKWYFTILCGYDPRLGRIGINLCVLLLFLSGTCSWDNGKQLETPNYTQMFSSSNFLRIRCMWRNLF